MSKLDVKDFFMNINLLFAGFLFILILINCEDNRPVEEQMQYVLNRGIKEYGIHGVSATVIFPDKHIWTAVNGFSHDTVTIKPDMVFAIGSITKNIMAALTLKLAEENYLSLEDPISKWLPAYAHVENKIIIRQLLNHTSGIYNFWDNEKIWDELKKNPLGS